MNVTPSGVHSYVDVNVCQRYARSPMHQFTVIRRSSLLLLINLVILLINPCPSPKLGNGPANRSGFAMSGVGLNKPLKSVVLRHISLPSSFEQLTHLPPCNAQQHWPVTSIQPYLTIYFKLKCVTPSRSRLKELNCTTCTTTFQ
jgi:hypothetical protein